MIKCYTCWKDRTKKSIKQDFKNVAILSFVYVRMYFVIVCVYVRNCCVKLLMCVHFVCLCVCVSVCGALAHFNIYSLCVIILSL